MAANNPPPAPVAQPYVIKTVEMQGMQNPMHTVAGTVVVQQVNQRQMNPAGSSVSQI